MRSRWRGIAVSASIAAVTAAIFAVPGLAGASAAPTRVTLHGSRPAYAARTRPIGSARQSASVSVRVYLAPKGGSARLAAAAKAVSTPGNAHYRHFLTVAQYQARFAPTGDAVSSCLPGYGPRVCG